MATTYATKAAVSDYLQATYRTTETVTDADIQVAERDIDMALGNGPRNPQTGLRLTPGARGCSTPAQRNALVWAVAEQLQYRRVLTASDPDAMARPQYSAVSGDGFSVSGTRPHVSPTARRYLVTAGILTRLGTIGSARAWDPSWFELGWDSPEAEYEDEA